MLVVGWNVVGRFLELESGMKLDRWSTWMNNKTICLYVCMYICVTDYSALNNEQTMNDAAN